MIWVIAIVSTLIFIFMLHFMLEHDNWFKDSDLKDFIFTIIGIVIGCTVLASWCEIFENL